MTSSAVLRIKGYWGTQHHTEHYLISWGCYLHVQGDSRALSYAHIPPMPGGLALLQADEAILSLFPHPHYIPHTTGAHRALHITSVLNITQKWKLIPCYLGFR